MMSSWSASGTSFEASFDVRSKPARLTVSTTGEKATQMDLDKLLDFLERVARSNVQFVSIFDLRKLGSATLSQLRALGEWCKAHEQVFNDVQLAIAILLKANFWSGAAKGLISVVTTMAPPTCPLLMCHTLESVDSFFAEKLGAMAPVEKPTLQKSRTFESVDHVFAPKPAVATSTNPLAARHISEDSVGESAPHVDATPCCPRASAEVLLPSAWISAVGRGGAHQFLDLEDLETDATLLNQVTEEIVEDDTKAIEMVRVLAEALEETTSSRSPRNANGYDLFVRSRSALLDANTAQLEECNSPQIARRRKHPTCSALDQIKSKWLRSQTYGPRSMSKFCMNALSIKAHA